MLKSRAIARFTSFTLLSADSHALLHRCQQNGNEKRMPVILGEGVYDAWFSCCDSQSHREEVITSLQSRTAWVVDQQHLAVVFPALNR
jgi:putative SOS response-associated peptidase YedK